MIRYKNSHYIKVYPLLSATINNKTYNYPIIYATFCHKYFVCINILYTFAT